jgi:hypothetical protein
MQAWMVWVRLSMLNCAFSEEEIYSLWVKDYPGLRFKDIFSLLSCSNSFMSFRCILYNDGHHGFFFLSFKKERENNLR